MNKYEAAQKRVQELMAEAKRNGWTTESSVPFDDQDALLADDSELRAMTRRMSDYDAAQYRVKRLNEDAKRHGYTVESSVPFDDMRALSADDSETRALKQRNLWKRRK